MLLKVKPGRADELGREIVYVIKPKLPVTPEVEGVKYGAPLRTDRKSKRVLICKSRIPWYG